MTDERHAPKSARPPAQTDPHDSWTHVPEPHLTYNPPEIYQPPDDEHYSTVRTAVILAVAALGAIVGLSAGIVMAVVWALT